MQNFMDELKVISSFINKHVCRYYVKNSTGDKSYIVLYS